MKDSNFPCSRRKATEKEEDVEDPSTSYTPTYTTTHTPSHTPSYSSSYTPSYTSFYTPSTSSSYTSQYSLRREDPVGALLPGLGEPGRAREGVRQEARERTLVAAREEASSIEEPARDWQVPGTKRRGYRPPR